MFIIHIHDPFWTTRSWFLAGFIFLALLLLSRVNFLRKQESWRRTHTHMPPYIGIDFLRATLIAGAIMIVFAWTVPALASNASPARALWQRISRPLQEARAEMSNAFASLRSSVGVVNEYYGGSLPLGRGNVLNDSIIMTIQAPPRPAAGVRYYWRARVYDDYDAGHWDGNFDAVQLVEPDSSPLILPEYRGRWEADFIFTPHIPLITLYTVPQPTWISRPVNAEVFNNEDRTVDLTSVQVRGTLQPGEQYEIKSSLTNVTENELRAAGTNYPDWVKARYLLVPDSITPRTAALAQEIAKDHENPYDIAAAVTNWLRENIQYNDTVPTPPADQEPIDWVLFDLKQGFCNYYASAEIMMLRSLGIPARLAVGYAQGQRDVETDTYTVQQRDAHAWPEVFFPGIGWVEFEPTLNQRPIRRPVGDPVNEEDPNQDLGLEDSARDTDLEALLGFEPQEDQTLLEDETAAANQEGMPPWTLVIIPGILIMATAGFAFYRQQQKTGAGESGPKEVKKDPLAVRVENRIRGFGLRPPRFIQKWAYQAQLPPQAKSYQEINKALTRLGFPPEPNYTPSERATSLTKLLPEAAGQTLTLLHEYQALAYASSPGDPTTARAAAKRVRSASWSAYFQRFFSRFQEPRKRETLV